MSGTESRPFPPVAGFKIKVHIGGGGFASVYKAVNSSGVVAACKVIAITRTTPASARKAIEKEVSVHGSLRHPNIVEMMAAMMVEDEDGVRYVPGAYLLLEMAHGGDLFDKIAPNVGVEDGLAHHYMEQLIAGLSYIHERGICHRDIKPENLLLSLNGELKLCDFGLCSVYKYKGQIRRLKDRCGSLPYIAPELAFEGAYDGAPIDVWGAGIILFTLQVGSTPWDEATQNASEYVNYLDGSIWEEEPWSRIRGSARALVMGLLHPKPQKRFTLADAKQHVWFQRQSQFATQSAAELAHRLTQSLRDSGDMNILEPGTFERNADSEGTEEAVPMGTSSGFTQSLNFFTQLPNGMKYSPHLTRFFASLPPNKLAPLLIEALSALGVKYKVKLPTTVLVGGYDMRKEKFKGRVVLEGFKWKGVECSIVEMAREEGNPISWRQFWKATVKASQMEPHLLRRQQHPPSSRASGL